MFFPQNGHFWLPARPLKKCRFKMLCFYSTLEFFVHKHIVKVTLFAQKPVGTFIMYLCILFESRRRGVSVCIVFYSIFL